MSHYDAAFERLEQEKEQTKMVHPNKAMQVMELLNTAPEFSNADIAAQVGCTDEYVRQLRKKMVHAQNYDEAAEVTGALDFNDAPTQEELDVALETASVLNPTTLDAVLNERGSRYGSFIKHAVITQRLKAVMGDTPNWIVLNDDMVEALEMIAHKIGRILNGDPTYADSWVDIAGYAQLVADRLQGKER